MDQQLLSKEDINQQLLSIGKMAELNHVSISTLRLYDQNGLLKPYFIDPQTNYRYYTIQQTARLDMINYMKELGMSLSEIRDVFERKDLTLVEELLIQKNEQLHEQMRELKTRHDAVERAINSIERFRKSPDTGIITLEYIDLRYIWSIPCPYNFYEIDEKAYEASVIRLRQSLIEAKVPQIYSYNLGTSISIQNYQKQNYQVEDIFIISDKRLLDYPGTVSKLESGMYACVYVDNYEEEMKYAGQLFDYCHERNLIFAGDYLCEELTEFNVFDNFKRNMFIRLQIPVIFPKNSCRYRP